MPDGQHPALTETDLQGLPPRESQSPLQFQRSRGTDEALFAPTRAPLSVDVLRTILRLADTVVMVIAVAIALASAGLSFVDASLRTLFPFVILMGAVAVALKSVAAYHHVKRRSFLQHTLRVANASGIALIAALIVLLPLNSLDSHPTLVTAALIAWLGLSALHACGKFALDRLTRSGHLSDRVVIVGATPNALRLIERNAETRKLNIVGVFDDRLSRAPSTLGGVPVLGRIDDLLAWDRLPRIDRIIVTVTSDARERVRTLIDRLRWLPNRVVLLLDLEGFDPERQSLAEIADAPAAYVSGAPADMGRVLVKRVSDIILASAMLIAFAPVMAVCALLIHFDSPGPIFFRQKRHGFNNEIIKVWKFRTMRPDTGAQHRICAQTTADDPRITRIGRFLRRTSLDELPQLLNVLSGEMSLVGPRPHAIGMAAEATEVHDIVSDYAHRHRVKPGITGWAQINGSRGPVHTKEGVRERVRLDLEYINRASFGFDLYILLKTAPCLLGDRNIIR
jgi:Undecaprenyl-phosphate glucose phosphotransferase